MKIPVMSSLGLERKNGPRIRDNNVEQDVLIQKLVYACPILMFG